MALPYKSFRIAAMSDHLPDELVIKILERLPVKSLIRCTSVCKPWYSLITSPSFITQHLNRINSPDQIVKNGKVVFKASLADGRKTGLYSLSCDNSFYNHLKLDVKLHGSGLRHVEIVGTCSGLVCLKLVVTNKKKDDYVMVIWNPSIRKTISILCSQRPPLTRTLYGFFVHPTTHHYKLLVLYFRINNGSPYHAEIYRQHTGVWSDINCVFPCPLDWYYSQACVNGVVYWHRIGLGDTSRGVLNSIALFNMHTEAFSEVTLPPCLVHKDPTHLRLFSSRESLILCETDFLLGDFSCHSIWVFKEHGNSESWCKLFNFKPLEWLTPYGMRMNGELLLRAAGGKSLVCHDPVTNRTTTIPIEGVLQPRSVADTYVESLLLLNSTDADSEHDSFGEFLSE